MSVPPVDPSGTHGDRYVGMEEMGVDEMMRHVEMAENESAALRQAQERSMYGDYGGYGGQGYYGQEYGNVGMYGRSDGFGNPQDEDYGAWDPQAYQMYMSSRMEYQGYNQGYGDSSGAHEPQTYYMMDMPSRDGQTIHQRAVACNSGGNNMESYNPHDMDDDEAKKYGQMHQQWADVRGYGGNSAASVGRRKGKFLTAPRICTFIAMAHIIIFMVSGPFWAMPKPREGSASDAIGAMIEMDSLIPTPLPIPSPYGEKKKIQTEEVPEKPEVDIESLCAEPSIADTLTIVTAASDWYFGKLIQLLKSLASYEPRARVVVYDIGLTEDHRFTVDQWLKKWQWPREYLFCHGIVDSLEAKNYTALEAATTDGDQINATLAAELEELKYNESSRLENFGPRASIITYPFDKDPPHFAVKYANRAWKVGSVKKAVDTFDGLMLWVDAENKITGELLDLRKAIKEKKLIAESLQATVGEWTHRGMLKYLQVTQETREEPMLNSGLLGLDASDEKIKTDIVDRWHWCAQIEHCILPVRASRASHRDEQSSLSIIAHQSEFGSLQRPYGIAKYNVSLHKHPNAALAGLGGQRRLSCSPSETNLSLTVMLAASGHTTKDSDYVTLLLKTIRSVLVNDSDSRIVVFDLGMDNTQQMRVKDYIDTVEDGTPEEVAAKLSKPIEELEKVKQKPWALRGNTGPQPPAKRALLRSFLYGAYPSHMVVGKSHHTFAWKAAAFATIIEECEGQILWLDAGNIVQGPLTKVREFLKRDGFVSVYTTGTIKDWTHEGTIAFMSKNMSETQVEELRSMPNLSGSIVGFDASNELVLDGVFEPWRLCAWEKDCIAPEGADKTNHRFDQAALSIAAHKYGIPLQPTKVEVNISVDGRLDSPLVSLGRNMDDWLMRHVSEWIHSFDKRPFQCKDVTQARDLDLTVVFAVSSHPTRQASKDSNTGAVGTHVDLLLESLSALDKKDPGVRIIVYDLGMDPDEQRPRVQQLLDEIEDNYKKTALESLPQDELFKTHLRPFDYQKYSDPHFQVKKTEQTSFGWKSALLADVMADCGGRVLWLDASSLVIKPLTEIRRILKTTGFVSTYTAGDIRTWTHPSTLEALNVQPDDKGEGGQVPLQDAPNLSGAVFGFDSENKAVIENIFDPFLKCSIDVNCIAPEGAEKNNHRYDQAVLSVLSQRYGITDLPSKRVLGVLEGSETGGNALLTCDDSISLTVIMAASKHKEGAYVSKVISTLKSLEKDDHVRAVIYDMGMEKEQRELIENHINLLQNKSADGATLAAIRDFRYSDYPDHFRLGSFQTFAWKGVMMEAVMEECGGSVLWLSGGQLLTGSNFLNEIRRILALDGIVATYAHGAVKHWTHIGMRKYLKIDEDTLAGKSATPVLDSPLLSGAIIGFNSGNKVVMRKIFKPWVDCLKEKACISPTGAEKKNHAYEQSALSIFAYKQGIGRMPNRKSLGLSYEDLICESDTVSTTIVTAVSRHKDGEYINKLRDTLGSLKTNLAESRARIVVFDLGLDANQVPEIQKSIDDLQSEATVETGTIATMREFKYNDYPEHFKLGSKQTYAWKAAMLETVAYECGGNVLWLDAGSVITGDAPLREIRKILTQDGLVSTYTSGSIAQWAHSKMLEYLGTKPSDMAEGGTMPLLDAPNLSGSLFGLNTDNPKIMDSIFQPWVFCAMDVNCISPVGSSKSNHRYDQAALSVLAQKYGIKDLPSRKRLGVSLGSATVQTSACDSSVKLTVLTAASKHNDGQYVNNVIETIESFEKIMGEAKARLLVYDIGLERDQISTIQQAITNVLANAPNQGLSSSGSPLIALKAYNFPLGNHFKLGSQNTFAWKADLFNGFVNECQGWVLWIDSGSKFSQHNPLREVRKALTTDGYVFVPSNGVIKDFPMSSPLQKILAADIKGIDAHGEKTPLVDSIRISTSLFGFDADNKAIIDTIFQPWVRCMMEEECVTLSDGSKTSTRIDETAFSMMFHLQGIKNVQTRKAMGISFKGLQCDVEAMPLTVITAASRHKKGEYVTKLMATINSFINAGNDIKSRLIVYDLGMDKEQRQDVQELLSKIQGKVEDHTVAQLKTFSYSELGDHFKLGTHQTFAWKAVLMQQIATECGGQIFWLDAGEIISETNPLREVRKILSSEGFITTYSSGTVEQWTHPGMLQFLGVTEDEKLPDGAALLQAPNLSGQMFGFDTSNADISTKIFKPWVACAMEESCISPQGAERSNHRYDQAALTVIAMRSGIKEQPSRKRLGIND